MRRPLALLLLSPFMLAWSGGGSGSGVWSDSRVTRSVSLSGLVEYEADVRVALNGTVPGGESMVFITVPALLLDQPVSARDQAVEVSYREYGPDGRLRFAADVPESGQVRVSRGSRWVTVTLSAIWYDSRAARSHRQWSDVDLRLTGGPTSPSGGHRSSGGAEVHGGCDTTIDSGPADDDYAYDDYDDSSGCEGDDWESDSSSDWDSGESSGCEGDDMSGSSGGGCEGDDMSGSSGGSCEGDAIASTGTVRRSPTMIRLFNQLPWLMVLIGLRVARRRRV